MARNSPKASQSRGNIREVQRKFQNNGRRQNQEYRPQSFGQEGQGPSNDPFGEEEMNRYRRLLELDRQQNLQKWRKDHLN